MNHSRVSVVGRAGVVLSLFLLMACSESPVATAPELDVSSAVDTRSSVIVGPMMCFTMEPVSASKVIDSTGGVVSVGGHSVTIPSGALKHPTRITVARPASPYLEIELRANDEEHFTFEKPVTVTISYAECGAFPMPGSSRSAWYVDSETKQFLEKMNTVDDPVAQTVTFPTDHFSYYMVAT